MSLYHKIDLYSNIMFTGVCFEGRAPKREINLTFQWINTNCSKCWKFAPPSIKEKLKKLYVANKS